MMEVGRRGALTGLSFLGLARAARPLRAQAAQSFTIGAVLPRTGAASQYGDFVQAGLLVGIKQVNGLGGILGRQAKLLVRDDATNPGRALLGGKELVSDQNVDFLYPGVISGTTMAVLPYTTQQKLFTISNGASPQIGDAGKFPYSFQLADLSTKRAPAMAAAMKRLGGTRVGILVSTNPPQVALGDALAADLPTKYGLPVAAYVKYAGDSTDVAPQLQSLRDAGADIVAFSAVTREGVRVVMTGMQTLGWAAKVVGEPAALYGDLTEQVPSAVQSQFFAVNYWIGAQLDTSTPERDALIRDLRELGPIQNLAISALARDVVHMCKWALETAQAESGSAGSDAVKSVMETIGKRKLPPGVSLTLGNPGYTPGDHTTTNADYAAFWSLIRVSKPVDGAYLGERLPI